MAKIKRTWARMTRDERLTFANHIKTSLTGNANVPAPNPALVAFTATIATAQARRDAVIALETQFRTARMQDAEAQDALIAALDTQSATVESATARDGAKISTTGFILAGSVQPPQPLGQPQDFTVSAGSNDGQLDCRCDPVANAASYEVQMTSDPNTPSSWMPKLIVSKSTFTLNSLTSGQRYWVRVRGIGALGPGPWSDPTTKIAP